MSPLNRVYVLDTNALLNDPEVLFAFSGAEVVIPGVVLDELDALKHRREDRRLRYHADDQILAIAHRLNRRPGCRFTLVTNDVSMLLRAEALALDTYRFEGKLEHVRRRRLGHMEWLRLYGVTLALGWGCWPLCSRPPRSTCSSRGRRLPRARDLSVVDAGGALETLGASPEQLEQHCRSLLERDPANLPAAIRLGDLLFDRAILDSPGHALAHYNLGVALAQNGEPARAIAELRKALDLAAVGGGNVPTADAQAMIDELEQRQGSGQ